LRKAAIREENGWPISQMAPKAPLRNLGARFVQCGPFIIMGLIISSLYRPLSSKRLDDVSGLTRSVFFGSVCGAFLLPALFPIWLAITVDDDFVKCCDGFGRRKKNIDDFLVIMLFAAWLIGVMFGYTSSGIPGAIAASLCVGSIAGAFLAFWVDQRKFV
jgi:hypothetical protein